MSWRAWLLLASTLALFGGCKARHVAAPFVRFTPVDDGVEYARFRSPKLGERPAFDGHAFRIDLARVPLRVLPAGGPTKHRDVRRTTRALERVVAVNGSFFDPEGRAMGLVVDQGRLLSRRRARAWGALVIKDGLAQIVGGRAVDLKKKPDLVLQGHPRLVKAGEVNSLKPQSAKRTAVCLTEPGDEGPGYRSLTLIVTSEVDATHLGGFLAQPLDEGGMGCAEALNLDGGPSTQLVARLGAFRVDLDGSSVPNALAALPGLPLHTPPPEGEVELEEALNEEDAGAASGADVSDADD